MTWLPASTLQKNKRQNSKAISLASLNLTTFISTVFFLNSLNLLFFCLFFVCFTSFLTRSNSAVQKTVHWVIFPPGAIAGARGKLPPGEAALL